ncbi:MAG: hypothetical protein M3321_11105 [Actinomycetota bacterium]|nr:hypothetical protein [Actinomycetota bacterium]
MPFRITAHVDGDVVVRVEDPARLLVAEPPQVVIAGRNVGEVEEPFAKPMRACLDMLFDMRGEVSRYSPEERRGVLTLKGARH